MIIIIIEHIRFDNMSVWIAMATTTLKKYQTCGHGNQSIDDDFNFVISWKKNWDFWNISFDFFFSSDIQKKTMTFVFCLGWLPFLLFCLSQQRINVVTMSMSMSFLFCLSHICCCVQRDYCPVTIPEHKNRRKMIIFFKFIHKKISVAKFYMIKKNARGHHATKDRSDN